QRSGCVSCPGPLDGQNELQTGLDQRGKVKASKILMHQPVSISADLKKCLRSLIKLDAVSHQRRHMFPKDVSKHLIKFVRVIFIPIKPRVVLPAYNSGFNQVANHRVCAAIPCKLFHYVGERVFEIARRA
ncbi:hypothetical protein NKJ46_11835, partial [Mesorhizobium sp. M0166]